MSNEEIVEQVHKGIEVTANQERLGKQNSRFAVATHLSCPQINQIECHRMNRYNGISVKKGKVSRTLAVSA